MVMTPSKALASMGNMSKAASRTTSTMIVSARGALRVRGRSAVPSRTSNSPLILRRLIPAAAPCTSSTSLGCRIRSPRPGVSTSCTLPELCSARISRPYSSFRRTFPNRLPCKRDPSVTATSASCRSPVPSCNSSPDSVRSSAPSRA
jgi:hypothetical protein